MKWLFIFTSLLVSNFGHAKPAELKTEAYVQLTMESQPADTILITQTLLDKKRGFFVSYSSGGRLLKKSVIDKKLFEKLLASFDRALSDSRQKALVTLTNACGEVLSLKTKSIDRAICLALASPQEREAIAKWWREVRSLLRV